MTPAQRLVFRSTGRPADVLELEHFTPSPGPAKVLVRLTASPINPADLNFIEGTYGIKPSLPAVPGLEGCGVVESTESPDFPPGTPVAFLHQAAAWASHACVPASHLLRLPAGIDPLQAAMLKVNPATAWRLLHGFANLKPGDWVVQNAATSGVGRCVIQLARDAGLRTISLVRRPETATDLTSLGADHVMPDDEEGLAAALELMGGRHAALALNAVGGESALRLMNLLRDGSPHVTYGAMARRPLTVPNGLLIFRDLSLHGFWLTRWIESTTPAEVRAVYQDLATRVAAGKLLQRVDTTYPLSEFPAALARVESPDRWGKVLFRS
jgi:NADPH:quinone reductase-like Zn-dependent oxidoreductase